MHYSLSAALGGKRCLIVGGGTVATRKAARLIEAGAIVTVVAPEISEKIKELTGEGTLHWHERAFTPEDVGGATLVFAATDDAGTNRIVAEAARGEGAWVNIADDPEGSDFHVPALLRRGEVTVAVSTGGSSPALAAWLRDKLSGEVPEGIEALAALCAEIRATFNQVPPTLCWRNLFNSEIMRDLATGDVEAAKAKVERYLGPVEK